MKNGFKATQNKGFQMTFQNEMTISVQFGYGSYCDNHHHPDGWDFSKKQDIVDSTTAEIAIWDKEGTMLNFGSDEVKGWCEADEVAQWIAKVQMASSLDDLA
jgi:hypothetical protein